MHFFHCRSFTWCYEFHVLACLNVCCMFSQTSMADWTPLYEVEEGRLSGRVFTYGPCLVWAANYVARNPFPRKFMYRACSHVTENGNPCNKSLEFGSRCGHASPGYPKFRFQVLLFDAAHGGCPPVRAHIWDGAAQLLNCAPQDFFDLDTAAQLSAVQKVFQNSPKLAVWLGVKDLELHFHHFHFHGDSTSFPAHPHHSPGHSLPMPIRSHAPPVTSSSPQGSNTPQQPSKREGTPSKPPSARKLLTDLIEALKGTDLDE